MVCGAPSSPQCVTELLHGGGGALAEHGGPSGFELVPGAELWGPRDAPTPYVRKLPERAWDLKTGRERGSPVTGPPCPQGAARPGCLAPRPPAGLSAPCPLRAWVPEGAGCPPRRPESHTHQSKTHQKLLCLIKGKPKPHPSTARGGNPDVPRKTQNSEQRLGPPVCSSEKAVFYIFKNIFFFFFFKRS